MTPDGLAIKSTASLYKNSSFISVEVVIVSPCPLFIQALGKWGARFTGLVYVFIHYSLLVAYMAQGGAVLTEVLRSLGDGW